MLQSSTGKLFHLQANIIQPAAKYQAWKIIVFLLVSTEIGNTEYRSLL